MERHKPEALIFDMDGTLFRTETIFIPAYQRAYERLAEEGGGRDAKVIPPVSLLLSSLGMPLTEIWATLLPDTDSWVRERMDELLLEELLLSIRNGEGELYPGVKRTLQALKKDGFRLFVASNGLEPYVKEVALRQGIAPLFDGLYSAGEYRTASKAELVRLLLAGNDIRSAWMVGDRRSDVDAGKTNGLFVVGCGYADFGVPSEELSEADVRIDAFAELPTLLNATLS